MTVRRKREGAPARVSLELTDLDVTAAGQISTYFNGSDPP